MRSSRGIQHNQLDSARHPAGTPFAGRYGGVESREPGERTCSRYAQTVTRLIFTNDFDETQNLVFEIYTSCSDNRGPSAASGVRTSLAGRYRRSDEGLDERTPSHGRKHSTPLNAREGMKSFGHY
jgi:hypothetical protein